MLIKEKLLEGDGQLIQQLLVVLSVFGSHGYCWFGPNDTVLGYHVEVYRDNSAQDLFMGGSHVDQLNQHPTFMDLR